MYDNRFQFFLKKLRSVGRKIINKTQNYTQIFTIIPYKSYFITSYFISVLKIVPNYVIIYLPVRIILDFNKIYNYNNKRLTPIFSENQ